MTKGGLMSEFHKLIYTSNAVRPFSEEDLHGLMVQARQKNQDFGITGCLIYHQSKIIQYLEGRKCLLEHVFSSIVKDVRHQDIQVLCRKHVDRRAFNEWSMALKYIPENALNDYKNVYQLFEDMMDAQGLSRISVRALKLFENYLHNASLSYGNLSTSSD
ncbi:MAG: BLUF domain-containing protein [Methylophaga sp.]|nr:BLUF domain-containing protein [Methylophaga sp.]